jgi:hypothetical protein
MAAGRVQVNPVPNLVLVAVAGFLIRGVFFPAGGETRAYHDACVESRNLSYGPAGCKSCPSIKLLYRLRQRERFK